MPIRVLFVCMGNICRSPAGEAVLQALAEQRGVEIEVDSAGTHDYHIGKKADSRMRAAGRSRNLDLQSRARQVTAKDLQPGEFDRVLAMDRANLEGLAMITDPLPPHVQLFSEYLDDSWPTDVPDPYYGGGDGFEYVLDMLADGCPRLLDGLVS